MGKRTLKVEDMLSCYEDVTHLAEGDVKEDDTLLTFFKSQGLSEEMLELADACFGNDFGTSLDAIGLRALIQEEFFWMYGEEYYMLPVSWSRIVDRLATKLSVKLNWKVNAVVYGHGGAQIMSACGETLRARAAVVTVPLTILQSGDIAFTPPLPDWKTAALSVPRMETGVKVIARFSQQFWPEDMYDIVAGGAAYPELWFEFRDGVAACVGFACGVRGQRLAEMGEEAALRAMVDMLDDIFADHDPLPSALFERGVLFDWSAQPFIRGAYTYPAKGDSTSVRTAIARPLSASLFFAGEATNVRMNPTVHGCLESAARVAEEVRISLSCFGKL
eukprot:PLAT9012.1.p1 GENE.PLAT9012.1~~PLAT9012.1.p1  ORF type:complete len:333 (+),score=97.48 PLAT9012.1:275-1273(+)